MNRSLTFCFRQMLTLAVFSFGLKTSFFSLLYVRPVTAKSQWHMWKTTAIECFVKGKPTMEYVTVRLVCTLEPVCLHCSRPSTVWVVPVVLWRISQAFFSPCLNYFLFDQILKGTSFTNRALGDLK